MSKINRQWYSPVCVSAVFAAGLFLGKLVSVVSNGLLQETIFIGAAVLAFHLSNLIPDVVKAKSRK